MLANGLETQYEMFHVSDVLRLAQRGVVVRQGRSNVKAYFVNRRKVSRCEFSSGFTNKKTL